MIGARQGGHGAIQKLVMLLCVVFATALAATADAKTGPRPAAAGTELPAVRLRTGEHDGYSRLVFDWSAPVAYRLEQAPGRAVLHFEQRVALDLSAVRASPPRLISAVQARRTARGLTVELSLPRGVSLRHFLSGPKVVVDALAPRVPGTPDGAATGGAEPAGSGATPAVPDAIAADSVLAATVGRSAAKPQRHLPPVRPTRPTRLEPGTEAEVRPPVRPRQAKPPATVSAGSRRKIAFAFERSALPPLRPVPGSSAPRYRPLTLRAIGAADAAAAAFRRGRSLWLIFDRPAPADISGHLERFAPELSPLEQRVVDGATVIRLTAPVDLAPALRRVGDDWLVELRPQLARPEAVIEPATRPGTPQTRVFFPVAQPGRLLVLDDPELGGRLFVLPVRTPRLGLAATHEFPQFRALASHQGLVVAPRSDRLRVALSESGLEVTSEAGLLVTPDAAGRRGVQATASATPSRRLFELLAWRHGEGESFDHSRKILQSRLAAPGASERPDLVRLDLGRFYFAHGLAAEALSVLNELTRENPRLSQDPEVILLKAASLFLVDDYQAAADGLGEPALADEPDALVWRGALAAASQDWSFAAEAFDRAGALIDEYVRPVRTRLRLLAAEARLGIGDTGGASLYLEQVREDLPTTFTKAQIDFLEGRRLQLDGEPEKAEDLWRRVARGTHTPSSARARLALIDLGLETGALDRAAAIEELERLRFIWRADAFEMAVLERLGDLYAAEGDYRNALLSLRRAASHFPGSPRAEAVAGRMRKIFNGLYLDGGDAALPPLRALALYEEFKELTPVGPAGDRMIARLVERLVQVELLDSAAALLERQIRRRLSDEDRSRAGARLAAIRLLDRAPERALDALTRSQVERVSTDLRVQRRRLEAQALAELGREREALARLAGDDSKESLRLRAAILWQLRDWPAAAVALTRLVPRKPPSERNLDNVEEQAVLDLAVAYSLAGDRRALSDLKRRYGAAMAAGSMAASFALLTSDFGRPEIVRIAEELAGVERIQAFMASYRARLKESGAGAVN